ncbi:PREDICTED: NACHT, LRR and PYD domains-containing protein 1-like isoform X2 [Chinchilla lanigera]|uniref:NACHT, LRR and PYD domains-containing protein 1-like isoform X2 n=1 Tax=Chinchilla lanigera TaxID=34839 RepID=UPI000698B629|nr:PREDICTED: NACHT, LRR and PYD domains-containing protein 1-like isoform X2 [Chinchilla lanigera]
MEISEAVGIAEEEQSAHLHRAKMAGKRKYHLLVYYLDLLEKEELKEFQLLLQNKTFLRISPTTTAAQAKKISGREVALWLVAEYGEQQAWDLAIKTWEQMGLTVLCDKARREVFLTWGARGSEKKSLTQPSEKSVHSKGIEPINFPKISEKSCPTQSRETKYFHEKFTQLLLLRTPHFRSKEYLAREMWIYESKVGQGHLIKIQDLFGPVPGTQEESHRVVLYGAAGIGKSTLARQVRGAWEEGWLFRDRFRYVFYFNCRDLPQCQVNSMEEVIAASWASTAVPIMDILSSPEQVLFILDNVDQPKLNLRFLDSKGLRLQAQPKLSHSPQVRLVLDHLLQSLLFVRAFFLITARTTSLEMFPHSWEKPRWVEVLGFSEWGRKDYFKKYFTDESQSIIAFSAVEPNPLLLAQCLVPWVCWLVCTCLQQQIEQGEVHPLTSQTTTGLFLHYLSQVIPTALQEIQLRCLCSLAAEGIWRRKTLFSTNELSKHGLEGALITTFLKIGFLQEHPDTLSYSFTHQCFQEFFAALSCVLGNSAHTDKYNFSLRWMTQLLKEYRWPESSRIQILCFLSSLLSDYGAKEMKKIFSCQLLPRRSWELLQIVRPHGILLSQYYLNFFHYLYETQDEELVTHEMAHFQERRVCVRTDRELLLVTFCVKFCNHVKWLQLNESDLRKQERRRPGIAVSTWARLTDASWKVLFSVLQSTGSLEELALSGNPLSLSAVQSLGETLGQPRCCLQTLRLAGCGLTAKGCKHLAFGLSTSQTLTELELDFNMLTDAGAQHLCLGLKHPSCKLQRLRLVHCGLTSTCCQDLASVLSTSPSLKELDLQQNELGSYGVQLLFEGLRNPTCRLTLLWLDLTLLNEEELRIGEQEKPQLLISSGQIPDTRIPPEDPEEAEESYSTSSFMQQRPQLGDLHMEALDIEDDFCDPTGPLPIELVNKDGSLWRVHFPMAGYYHWPHTGLSFVVRREVMMAIQFCAWDQFLSIHDLQDTWMVAGPLFDIKAEQGAVAAVYLPHFVALQREHVDRSLFQVAHFKEEGMLLDKPDRVEPHHTILENPTFSPMGVLLKIIPGARRFFRVTCTTLLYHHIHAEEVKFHLYLIPSDCTIRQAIDDEEKKFQFERIHKPPPTDPLYLGSRYIVSGSGMLEIMPKELELCYRSPRQPQLFSEIYVGCLGSGIQLEMRYKKDETVVWEALLKPGDLRPAASLFPPSAIGQQRLSETTASASPPNVPASLHFVDQHREQLVARVTSVDSVLDKLLSEQVLSEEQYTSVRAEATKPSQMRKLFSFSPSWNSACKDKLYQALREIHPHLIMDLWEAGAKHSGDL